MRRPHLDRLRRFTPRHLTLRRRIALILIGCLLISCALVAAVSTLALRQFLFNRLDQQLTAAGNRYALSLEHPGDGDSDDKDFESVVGQPVGTLGARIKDGVVTSAGVVGDSDGQSRPTAETRAALARLTVSRQPHTIDLPDLGDYRLLVSAGQDGDILVTGLPEHPVDETIVHLLAIELIVFAGALVISGLVATVCVRLTLRPLTRVAGTALQVSNLPLASGEVSMPARVENPSPGTEVGQVAVAFNHMLEHVESALSVRQASENRLRQFIADASHELRTPIAVVRSHAEFAQHVGADRPDDVTHALERITAESGRMGLLVDELLLLARLDSARPLVRKPVDLTRLALDAVRDAQAAGPDHVWQLELPDVPVSVPGDEHSLHQALANLLANARDHTPAGTTVTVTVTPAVADGPTALDVTDDGPGIPAAVQPRIFERFVHADTSARRASSGSGLGLSIVAAIVDAHQGRIELTSVAGRTRFRIELPSADDGI